MQRMIPLALQPIARTVYHKVFRLHLRLRFWCADRFGTPTEIPVPPAMLRYRVNDLRLFFENDLQFLKQFP